MAEDEEIQVPLLQRPSASPCSSEMDSSDSKHASKTSLVARQIYRRRWLMLFIFCSNTFVNGVLFTGLSAITNIAATHYDESPVAIEWLSNLFLLAYVFFGLPFAYAITKYGIRPTLVLASLFDMVGAIFHYFGYKGTKFWYVAVGQFFAAVAYAGIIHIPGQLSAKWFSEDERATATGIGVSTNILGVAVGFLQTTQMVGDWDVESVERSIRSVFITQFVIIAIVFALTVCFYREKPPTPPTNITYQAKENVNFKQDVVDLLKDKYFVYITQSYGIYFALFVTFMVLLNDIVTTVYKVGYESKIGWMGFSGLMSSIVSIFLVSVCIDRYHAHRVIAILLNAASAIVWLIFVLILTNTTNFIALFIAYGILATVGIPFFSSGIEQAAEMTYPIPEIISSTVILFFGNGYGFLLILGLGVLSERGYVHIVCYVIFSLFLVSTMFAYLAKTKLKRLQAEDDATYDDDDNNDDDGRQFSDVVKESTTH